MTLELNQVAPQVKAMGRTLAEQSPLREETRQEALNLLKQFSTEFTALNDRIQQAERVQQSQRFDWVGAAPTNEALSAAYPLPPCPERVTVIAGDGSQILPDPHGITLYYLINTGSIIYRHGSNLKPETYNPPPQLCFNLEELVDEQGRLISPGEVNVKRDVAELEVLIDRANYLNLTTEPVIALLDGQLSLRVIDLPFHQQEDFQRQYISRLDALEQSGALLAGYIDRPRSTFVLALLHLAALELETISEASLRFNPFRHLTDIDLFSFLGPGERSAIFSVRAKGLEKYTQSGHAIHFCYLNVGSSNSSKIMTRIELPAWLVTNPTMLDILHATIVRQARITGDYPYVLARAHELAVIPPQEREALERMIDIEMRKQKLNPAFSPKQRQKNLLTNKRGY